MLFASLDFLLFLPPVIAGFWLLSRWPALRLAFLIVASYFFYTASAKGTDAAAPWYFAGLLFVSTLVGYFCALLTARAQRSGSKGLFWTVLSVLAHLGVLIYFKYTNFFLECAEELARLVGRPFAAPELSVALPLGVSFYTFQSIGYTVDVYKRTFPAERNFLRYALFVVFFPHLVSGPILRGKGFLPLLRERLKLSLADVNEGLYRIAKGLVKKLIFADFIATSFTDIVLGSPASYSTLENLIALYAFTLQIYADFSGYCDIALGVARLFGLKLPENFDRPYLSTSVGEFWRRWHMTLSGWLREYVFFPLGGSRVGEARAYFNTWLTLFLVGMWHGASFNFVIYGNLQAFAMVFDRTLRKRPREFSKRLRRTALHALLFGGLAFGAAHVIGLAELALLSTGIVVGGVVLLGLLPRADEAPWLRPLHVAFTFHFVVLSRVFFRADTLELARETWFKLTAFDGAGVRDGLFRISAAAEAARAATWMPASLKSTCIALADQGILVLIVCGLAAHLIPRGVDRFAGRVFARVPALGVACLIGMVCATLPRLLDGPRPNIYFAF